MTLEITLYIYNCEKAADDAYGCASEDLVEGVADEDHAGGHYCS